MRLRSGRTIGVVADQSHTDLQRQQEGATAVVNSLSQTQVEATPVPLQTSVPNATVAVVPHYNQNNGLVTGMQHYNNDRISEVEVSPSTYHVESPHSAEEQIERMVGVFCSQTERLAGEHAILLARQQQQVENQQEALHAVHACAQQNVEQLAGHQRATEVAIHNALVETREVLLQQLHRLASEQNERSDAIRKDVDEKLRLVLHEAQIGAQAMIDQQAKETRLVEERLTIALNQQQSELSTRIGETDSTSASGTAAVISDQLDARLGTLQEVISDQLEGLVQSAISATEGTNDGHTSFEGIAHLVNGATEEAENRIERRMRLALQQSQHDFEANFEEQVRSRDLSMRRHMEAMVHVTADETERRIEEKLRNALSAAQEETRIEFKRQAEETLRLRERMDVHEVNVHSRLDSLSSRVTAMERTHPTSLYGLANRLNAVEKRVVATDQYQERLEAIEKRCGRAHESTSLEVRVKELELKMESGLRINTTKQVEESTNEQKAAISQRSRDIVDLEVKRRINIALAQATARIDALAERYESDAELKAAKLEEKIKSLLGIANKQEKRPPRRTTRPTRRLTKQEVIANAHRDLRNRAEAAAERFNPTKKPKHRIIVHID